jgi:hypothetical protein
VALLGVALHREHPGVGAVATGFVAWAALSPLQANYGLNTSPYPWTLLLVAAATLALRAAVSRPEPRPWIVAAVLMGLAVQTHVLAFAVAVAQALWLALHGAGVLRDRRRAVTRWAAVLGIFCVPMLVGSLTKTSDPWTFHIEEGGEPWVRTAWMVLHERFGGRRTALWLGAALAGSTSLGVVLRPRGLASLLVLGIAGWMSALALFIELGVADPRLSHYYLVPHLLGLAAGASGLAAGLERWGRAPALRIGGLLALAVGTGLWASDALRYQLGRQGDAERALADAEPVREAVRAAFAGASEGDVVAYLWNHEFLNDEPEYLDPYAAWPLSRVGRRCTEEHPPRGLCNAAGGSRFYFDPSAFEGALFELEEPLRLMVNQAHPPGRATLFLLPGSEAPPRPFPSEVWMAAQGATETRLPGGVTRWQFPVGARLEQPREPLPRPDEENEPD